MPFTSLHLPTPSCGAYCQCDEAKRLNGVKCYAKVSFKQLSGVDWIDRITDVFQDDSSVSEKPCAVNLIISRGTVAVSIQDEDR